VPNSFCIEANGEIVHLVVQPMLEVMGHNRASDVQGRSRNKSSGLPSSTKMRSRRGSRVWSSGIHSDLSHLLIQMTRGGWQIFSSGRNPSEVNRTYQTQQSSTLPRTESHP
jgi:hypothetical protein